MMVKKMNLPLPPQLHTALFGEARRRRMPTTRLVRSVLEEWVQDQEREREAAEIRRFAAEFGGTELDLDPELEEAGLEVLRKLPAYEAG